MTGHMVAATGESRLTEHRMSGNVPHGQRFVDRLSGLLTDVDGGIEHRYTPLRGAGRGKPVRLMSLQSCVERYEWKGQGVEGAWHGLQQLRTGLRDAVRANDGPACREASARILEWGGVVNGNLTTLDTIYGKGFCRLPGALRDATDELYEEDPDFRKFSRKEGGWRMNSGFTKLYALLGENGVIYDSRVAAGLGYLIADWCVETKRTAVPEALALRHVAGRGNHHRNSSRTRHGLHFKGANSPSRWARSNALANRILHAAVERAGGFAGGAGGRGAVASGGRAVRARIRPGARSDGSGSAAVAGRERCENPSRRWTARRAMPRGGGTALAVSTFDKGGADSRRAPSTSGLDDHHSRDETASDPHRACLEHQSGIGHGESHYRE